MSNFLAIATVTAALRRGLLADVQADVAGALVSTVRPDAPGGAGLPATGVNIFLYHAISNPNWRNADLPTRQSDGTLMQKPQMAVDLHYLFSFYGKEVDLEPQRLMGSTATSLHTRPQVTQALIQGVLADPNYAFLATSDLADQVVAVKFTPLALSLEDLAKLWSVFFQTKYVLSLAYQASVVLLEPRRRIPDPALPVRELNLYSAPLRYPVIERIVAEANEFQPILPASNIVIRGDRLRGEITSVEISGQTVEPTEVWDAQLLVTLPSELAAGVQSVQVRHSVQFSSSPDPHPFLASNLASFVLHPVIAKAGGNYELTITNVQGVGTAPRSADITVQLQPVVTPNQRVTLELLTAVGVAYTFSAQPRTVDATQISFTIQGIRADTYLFRVRVDGAESPLEEQDTDPTSPTFNQLIQPRRTIP